MNWRNVILAMAPRAKASIVSEIVRFMPEAIVRNDLTTPLRQAHFLAQLAHESAGFKTTTEYASGAAYEGRKDLGNTQPGDGRRFKGRGLIQLTGRANYAAASKALGIDLVGNPKAAAEFPAALLTAGWYWSTRRLNGPADRDDARAVTRKINGGLNGFEDRLNYLAKAKAAIAAEARKAETSRRAAPAPEPEPEAVEPPAPEPAEAEKPWWEKSPVVRSVVQLGAWAAAGGSALLAADWKVIAVLSIVGAAVAVYAIRYQTRKAK